MASVKKTDIPDVGNFMPTFWDIIKKYYIPENDNWYWEALIGEMTEAVAKAHNDKLVLKLAGAFLEYIEIKKDSK